MDEDPAGALLRQGIRVNADRILQDMQTRKIDGLTAMHGLVVLAREKAEANKLAEESGLAGVGCAVFWTLSHESMTDGAAFDAMAAAREIDAVLAEIPTRQENSEEGCRLRAQLYKPVSARPKDDRSAAIDKVMQVLEQAK